MVGIPVPCKLSTDVGAFAEGFDIRMDVNVHAGDVPLEW